MRTAPTQGISTIISDGTLTVTGTLADTTDVSVASGAVYDVDTTDTIQSLSGAGNVELASITLTTGDAGNDEISGVISGTGNLTKARRRYLNLKWHQHLHRSNQYQCRYIGCDCQWCLRVRMRQVPSLPPVRL